MRRVLPHIFSLLHSTHAFQLSGSIFLHRACTSTRFSWVVCVSGCSKGATINYGIRDRYYQKTPNCPQRKRIDVRKQPPRPIKSVRSIKPFEKSSGGWRKKQNRHIQKLSRDCCFCNFCNKVPFSIEMVEIQLHITSITNQILFRKREINYAPGIEGDRLHFFLLHVFLSETWRRP